MSQNAKIMLEKVPKMIQMGQALHAMTKCHLEMKALMINLFSIAKDFPIKSKNLDFSKKRI
jgi:hypothetical protein